MKDDNFVVFALIVGLIIGLAGGIWLGLDIREGKAIKAGVAQYNPLTSDFEFITKEGVK